MRLVHRDSAELCLPEVACALSPCMDHARVTPMHARERVPQAVFALGGENEMDVIGTETLGPDRDARLARRFGQSVAIGGVVRCGKEDLLPAVATCWREEGVASAHLEPLTRAPGGFCVR
jgi:hypothetical protein